MLSQSEFTDYIPQDEEVAGGDVRDLIRNRDGVDRITMPKEIESKLLPSELAWRENQKKNFEVCSEAALKGTDEQIVDFINLQRFARQNYIRDVYRSRPDFLDKDF